MKTYSIENENIVYSTETTKNGNIVKEIVGMTKQTRVFNETDTTITYVHEVWNAESNAYDIDIANTEPIIYNGTSYPVTDGQATITKPKTTS